MKHLWNVCIAFACDGPRFVQISGIDSVYALQSVAGEKKTNCRRCDASEFHGGVNATLVVVCDTRGDIRVCSCLGCSLDERDACGQAFVDSVWNHAGAVLLLHSYASSSRAPSVQQLMPTIGVLREYFGL